MSMFTDELLNQLDLDQLYELKTRIEQKIAEKRKEAAEALRREIERKATILGMSVEEFLAFMQGEGKGHRKGKKEPAPAVYRHPTNPNHPGWSGRGRVPAWIVEWENQGRSRDELRVR